MSQRVVWHFAHNTEDLMGEKELINYNEMFKTISLMIYSLRKTMVYTYQVSD